MDAVLGSLKVGDDGARYRMTRREASGAAYQAVQTKRFRPSGSEAVGEKYDLVPKPNLIFACQSQSALAHDLSE